MSGEHRTWISKGKLDDYLLSCGASDPRIIADRYSKEVEKELLQNEITGEIGHLLGLRGNLSKSSCRTTVKVADDACRAIYFGYNPLKGSRNCYDEREQLRRWIDKTCRMGFFLFRYPIMQQKCQICRLY